MPVSTKGVKFSYGVQANYNALTVEEAFTGDLSTIYFCTDTQRMFVGDTEYTRPVISTAGAPSDTSLPPRSLCYDQTNKELYLLDDEQTWGKVANFYTHPTFEAKVLGPTEGKTLAFGDTFTVPKITTNAEGHVTEGDTVTFTLPSAPAAAQVTVNGQAEEGQNVVAKVERNASNVTQIDVTYAKVPTTEELGAIDTRVDALETAPAAGIQDEDIEAWNGEIGAMAKATANAGTIAGLQTSKLDANAGIEASGAAYRIVQYDAKGLVTAGKAIEAIDVPELDAAKITTGAFDVARIPDLTLSKITDAGTAAAANVATEAIGTTADTKLVSGEQVKTYVDAAVADLSGAMHFVGVFDVLPDATDYAAGDVCIVGNKEYVLVAGEEEAPNAWHELGDESIYAVKGNIKNADIAADAAIDQSKINGLTDALAAKADTSAIPTQLPNPNVLTLGGKTYDGTAAVAIEKADITGLGIPEADTDTTYTLAATAADAAATITLTAGGSGSGAQTAVMNVVDGLSVTNTPDEPNEFTVGITAIAAEKITGAVAEATKATQDGAGQVIADTYATKQELTASALVWGTF